MNPVARPTHDAAIALAAEHLQRERHQAARTVRSHVLVHQEREEILDCLGLGDVPLPLGR